MESRLYVRVRRRGWTAFVQLLHATGRGWMGDVRYLLHPKKDDKHPTGQRTQIERHEIDAYWIWGRGWVPC